MADCADAVVDPFEFADGAGERIVGETLDVTAVGSGMTADDVEHVHDGGIEIGGCCDARERFVDDPFRLQRVIQPFDGRLLLLFEFKLTGDVNAETDQQLASVGEGKSAFHRADFMSLPPRMLFLETPILSANCWFAMM